MTRTKGTADRELAAHHSNGGARLVLSIGSYSTLIGSTGEDGVPAGFSFFGFIHFESVIFWLGTAVFMLALVKERK